MLDSAIWPLDFKKLNWSIWTQQKKNAIESISRLPLLKHPKKFLGASEALSKLDKKLLSWS